VPVLAPSRLVGGRDGPFSARKRRFVAVRWKHPPPDDSRLTIDRMGYYFYDSYLSNLEAGSPIGSSRESVSVLSELSLKNRLPKPLSPRKGDEDSSTTWPPRKNEVSSFALAPEQQRSADSSLNPAVIS
jgi:hypothetical protein